MSNIQPYIILNGTDSRSISGLLISSLPPISKPQVRTQIETVDGRDGDIVTPLGFSAYDKVINIGLTYNYDVDEIIEFFNSEGIVTFSNEPDKYYRYAIYEQIDFEKLIRFKTAEVTLHVQPFKFSTTEEPELFDVVSGQAIAVTNEGNTDSRPNLTIIGSGDIDVSLNGSQILSIELEDDQAVIIDSEDMNAYAAQSAIREVVADINPVQDLHGYSKPWSGGGGKNKLDYLSNLYTIYSGLTISATSGGAIHYQGTTTNAYCILTRKFNLSIPSGTTITVSRDVSVNYQHYFDFTFTDDSIEYVRIMPNTTSTTYTLPKDLKSIDIVCLNLTVGTAYNETVKFQLEYGSQATSWEPYSNICPISGFSALNVTRTGKNILPKLFTQTTTNGVTLTANSDGTLSFSGVATSVCFFIKSFNLKKGSYIFTSGVDESFNTYDTYISKDGTTIARGGNNASPNNFTLTEDSSLQIMVRVRQGVNTDGLKIYPMIRVSSDSDTDYEPYNGQTATVNLGQTVYGGVADITNGKLTLTHGYVLLSDLTWVKENTSSGHWRFYAGFSLHKKTSTSEVANFKCSHYKTVTANQTWQGVHGISNNSTANSICVCDEAYSDATSFQNSLTGVQLVYELATPTEIQLTPTQINNLLGVNNMYSDTGDITVKHKANGVIVTDTGAVVSFYAGLDDIEKGVLLNRAITGDYDKIRLRKGVNTFVLSGNARQFAIDKYSRWI